MSLHSGRYGYTMTERQKDFLLSLPFPSFCIKTFGDPQLVIPFSNSFPGTKCVRAKMNPYLLNEDTIQRGETWSYFSYSL